MQLSVSNKNLGASKVAADPEQVIPTSPLADSKLAAATPIAADLPPSSLDASQPIAAPPPPPIAADPSPLLTYSRRSKVSTGPSAPAADPKKFKSPPRRATSSKEPLIPISSTRLTSNHSMLTRSCAKINSSAPTALTADTSLLDEPRTYNQAKSNSN